MRSCYAGEVITWSSPAAEDDGISLLRDVLRRYLGTTGRLGMMMGRETALRMPLADFLALQDSMQGTMNNMALHNMTAAVQRIRMVKSRREIAKIRYICGLACDVFEGLPAWVSAGIPLCLLYTSPSPRD